MASPPSRAASRARVSLEFSALWDRHDVGFRRNERKRIVHRDLGVAEVNCLHQFSDYGRQRLLWFTPALGTDRADKLALLSVVGTQDFRSPAP